MTEILPGDYIAGFVDGEGCFALNFRRDIRRERKNKPIYFIWKAQFVIMLRGDDIEILAKIKLTLDCGSVIKTSKGFARYQVTDVNDLITKVIPFFQKYNLRAKKRLDFELWVESVTIIARNKRTKVNIEKGRRGFIKTEWNPVDFTRLEKIQEEMRQYKGRAKPWKWL